MAYHEAFWVVVGTAAPVLAVANVVAAADTMRMVVDSRGPEQRDKPPYRATIKPWRPMSSAELAYLKSTMGLFVNALILAAALWALGSDRDVMSLWIPGVVLLGSFIAILDQAQTLMLARIIAKRDRELGPPGA